MSAARTKPARSAEYRAAYARGRDIAYFDDPAAEARLERAIDAAEHMEQDDAVEALLVWLDWVRGDGQ